ncbi:hypothetical protein, partial [Streptomyces scabiei]|uniref:hypothetical protein n=1 Tax=Streptomyces scabiei TaxID=1930 RepID=UPI0038F604A4
LAQPRSQRATDLSAGMLKAIEDVVGQMALVVADSQRRATAAAPGLAQTLYLARLSSDMRMTMGVRGGLLNPYMAGD